MSVELDQSWNMPGWTRIHRAAIRDVHISIEARGAIAWYGSHRPGQQLTASFIQAGLACGKDKMRRINNELIEAGYLVPKQRRSQGGKFEGQDFILYPVRPELLEMLVSDEAIDQKLAEINASGTPGEDSPGPENPPPVATRENTVKPQVKPGPGNPAPVNPQQRETYKQRETKEEENPFGQNFVSTDEAEPLFDVPTGQPEPAPEPGSDADSEFKEFWATYPRKRAKGQARSAWRAARKKATFEAIMNGLASYVASPRRRAADISLTAHPATWLNGERWLDADEPEIGPQGKAGPSTPSYRPYRENTRKVSPW